MYFFTLLVFVCSFLYGLSAVLCKYGLQHDIEWRKQSLKSTALFLAKNKMWLAGVLLSFVTNIAVLELQTVLDVSVVYPILNFSYIFVLLLGYYYLNEILNSKQWFGVVTVIIGTVLILFIESPSTGQEANVWNLLIFSVISLFIIGYIIYTIYQQAIENYEIGYAICTGLSLALVQIYIKANTNLVTAELGHFSIFSMDSVLHFFTLWPFAMLTLFSVVSWICTQITYSHGNISISVPLFAVIQSVATLIFGFFIFNEQLGLQKIVGAMIIVSGVVIVIASTTKEVAMEPAEIDMT